jgi:hypothetical protein
MKMLLIVTAIAVALAGCESMDQAARSWRFPATPSLRHLKPMDVVILTSTGPTEITQGVMKGYRIGFASNGVVQYELGSKKGMAYQSSLAVPDEFFLLDMAMPFSKMKTGACSARFPAPTFLRVGDDVSPDLNCVAGDGDWRVASVMHFLVYQLHKCLLKFPNGERFYVNPSCSDPDKKPNAVDPAEEPWALPSPMPEK